MGDLDRREFLRTAGMLAGAGLGAMAAGKAVSAQDAEAGDAKAMKEKKVPRKQLGKTGKDVPILLMGCAQRFDPRYDPKLHRGFEHGVDYLDAALMYKSHKQLAPFIKQVGRDKLWITSKVPTRGNTADPAHYKKGLDKCLDEMGIKHLDLFFMHALNDGSEKYLSKEYLAMADEMKKAKKINFFGFSCHDGNVVQLLEKAAELGGIDVIMFRYNFTRYGDVALNRAMDKAKKAGIGLIAMKTQASVPKRQEEVVEFQSKDFTLGQAKLKAVWEDERIDCAVSAMKSVDQVEENVAAAKSPVKLGMHDFQQLRQLHRACAPYRCDGCSQICESRFTGETKVADTLRYLMYGDSYGELDKARRFYGELSPAQRQFEGIDFSEAVKACPNGVDIPARLAEAQSLLG